MIEKLRRELKIDLGFAASKIHYIWEFYNEYVKIIYQPTFLIGNDSTVEIDDNTISIPRDMQIQNLEYEVKITRDKAYGEKLVSSKIDYDVQHVDEIKYLHFKISEPTGAFREGDVIKFFVVITLKTDSANFISDLIKLNHPMHQLLLQLKFNKLYNIDPPIMRIFEPPLGFVRDKPSYIKELKTKSENENWNIAEHYEEYPRQNRIYTISWKTRK